MLNRLPRVIWVGMIVLVGIVSLRALGDAAAGGSYQVVKTIKIGRDGRWDYATLDGQGQFLYLPRSTHTNVVDTAAGKLVADIPGGQGLHGVALAPDQGRGFITDGQGAGVIVFDLKSNTVLGTIAAADDADGIIYDPASNHVFVACGDSACLIGIATDVDPKGGKADAPIDLGGKPEFLASDGQGKVFVNLADKAQLAVVDTKTMKVLTKYSTAPGTSPTGLSMDREHGVLFIGCRNRKMIVMNAKDGTILADLSIGPGVDATAFVGGSAFASCSDGTLSVIRETTPGKYEVTEVAKTALGARTMAVDGHTGVAYLPTADMAPNQGGGRPTPLPGTFKVVVVAKSEKP